MDITIIVTLLIMGSSAGFLAGLLGIGGGMIVVPVVLWALDAQGIHSIHQQHLAVGTSFAVMVFTTFSSMYAQYKKGGVRKDIVLGMAPFMVLGTVLGSLIASRISSITLQILFVIFTLSMAVKMFLDLQPKASRSLPKKGGLALVGSGFGVLCSWLGIGGGALSVPFMLYCNTPIHQAVGTSAALSWAIAVAGAISYGISGMHEVGLPAGSVGFWYLPVAGVLAIATVMFAPLGVKAAHRFSPSTLKIAFSCLMLVISAKMLWRLVTTW